jgi:hypothetical protein
MYLDILSFGLIRLKHRIIRMKKMQPPTMPASIDIPMWSAKLDIID